MSWAVTPQLKTLAGTAGAIPQAAILGLPIDGGFFAGYISHAANGVPTHALIVAPAATGATGTSYTLTTNLAWKTENTTTVDTTSDFDGVANTAQIVAAGIADHPAAEFCKNLNINGYIDWYLPSRHELDIAYYNLKPTTASNNTSSGINDYSVPKRTENYTVADPEQTFATDFKAAGLEQFIPGFHWSSTQSSSAHAWVVAFDNGLQGSANRTKTQLVRVRAFRRIAL